jgi:hypothetical protein
VGAGEVDADDVDLAGADLAGAESAAGLDEGGAGAGSGLGPKAQVRRQPRALPLLQLPPPARLPGETKSLGQLLWSQQASAAAEATTAHEAGPASSSATFFCNLRPGVNLTV